ncbi:helix-turn-helix protein [Pantoea ananatis]|nr:helix-turn-helix transcriptional regulator [Pantoea ananatis]PWK05779.1 helix-turn-helix protein [Pantoea ananatis]
MKNFYTVKTLSQLRPLLIAFRKEKGLTQKDISERLGVTQQTYARMEANKCKTLECCGCRADNMNRFYGLL